MPNPARPARAAEVAPRGWTLDDDAASPISADDARLADRSAARRMSGLPAGWPLPYGALVIAVPDERVMIRVRPATPARPCDRSNVGGVPYCSVHQHWLDGEY
jgi:hypothetical protein